MLFCSPLSPPQRTPPHHRGGPPLILPRILAVAALAAPLSSAEPPAWAPPILNRVLTASFPELSKAPIHIKELESASDFFRARPRLIDFILPRRMHYTLLVNPKASGLAATDRAAIEAIVAHELEHICPTPVIRAGACSASCG